MKILYIVEPRPTIGGGVRAAYSLADALGRDHGAETVIFGIHRKADWEGRICNGRVLRTTATSPMSLKYVHELYKTVEDFDPDVVHCLGVYTSLLLILYKLRKRLFLICAVHRATVKVRFGFLSQILNPIVAKGVDKIIFLTDYQKLFYGKELNFSNKSSVVIPNIVTEGVVEGSPVLPSREGIYVVFVGRIIPSKNLEVFIETVHLLASRGLDVQGVIVGGGEPDYVESLKNSSDLECVQFVGYVNNPEEYIRQADYILFPTRTEALPNLIIESFSMKKAVVCSNLPQFSGFCDASNSVLVDGFEPSDYADAIQKLHNSGELKSQIEIDARVTYDEMFHPRSVIQKYINVYERKM